jgi:hypothetical protein
MKFLIDNYSTSNNTESLYINSVLNLIEGCSSSIRSNDISVYDSFDLANPNFFITHANKISSDMIFYLKEHVDICIIVNISGINQENVTKLDTSFKMNGITKVIFFINYPNHGLVSKLTNIFVISHGADVFLTKASNVKYQIQQGIFVTNKSQITKREGTYHYLSTINSLAKDVDIFLPAMYMSNIYKNYDKLIFKPFGKIIPQNYFDAVLYGNMVEYEPDFSDDPAVAILANLFNGCDSFEKIKQQVKNKHTCLHRTKSLLSQLPCSDLVVKLGKIIGEGK